MDARTDNSTAGTGKTTRRPRARTVLGIAAGTALAAALLWFLFARDPVQVETATVTQGAMQVTIDNQGQVRVHDKYLVAAPVAA